jgi:hypothetical protein
MNDPSESPSKVSGPARPYRISLHWDPREQSLVSYAATTFHVLDALSQRSKVFEHWFIREEALTRLGQDRLEQLTRELEGNRKAWEFNDVQYTGCHALLTNGRRGSKQLELNLTCGLQTPSQGIWFANQLNVSLFGPSEGFPDLGSLEEFLALLVDDFSPAWASVLTPRTPERSLEHIYQGVPHVGWYTVFAPEYGVPPPIEGATSLAAADGYRAVRCVDTWFDDDQPAHVQRREHVERALEAAGFLRPRV